MKTARESAFIALLNTLAQQAIVLRTNRLGDAEDARAAAEGALDADLSGAKGRARWRSPSKAQGKRRRRGVQRVLVRREGAKI
jgi:hypothetical protein